MTDLIAQPILTVEIEPAAPITVALENAAAEDLIAEHEQKLDPHAQYANDSELIAHTTNTSVHIPAGGLTNAQIATNAAIDWSKINTDGAAAEDVGATSILHGADSSMHIPVGGISNNQIAPGAAIDWAKISKSGATAADVGAQASNSRLSEIGSLFAAAPSGASLRKASDGSAIEFAVPRSRILYRWGGTEIVSATTAETPLVNGSYTIPATTLSSSSTLDIYFLFSCSTSANNKTTRLKVGGQQIFINTSTAIQSVFAWRQIFFTSLNVQVTAGSNYAGSGTSNTGIQVLGIDFSQSQMIQLSAQLVDTTENLSLRYLEIRESR